MRKCLMTCGRYENWLDDSTDWREPCPCETCECRNVDETATNDGVIAGK